MKIPFGRRSRNDKAESFDGDEVAVDAAVDEGAAPTDDMEAPMDDSAVEESSGGFLSRMRSLGGAKNNGGPGRRRRGEYQLSSVIQESEPGAAFDLMATNERFTLVGEGGRSRGHVIMVLPTQDAQFGGLNARQKNDEDKGMIINLIHNDQIHAVVTEDMLEDDLLGFIPDEQTLETMEDFSILVGARYFIGIAVENPHTSALMIFVVPPKELAGNDFKSFDKFQKISDGDMELHELFDEDLLTAYMAILDLDEDGYGVDGLFNAVETTNRYISDFAEEHSELPSALQIVTNIYETFPKISATPTGRHHREAVRAADEVAAQQVLDEFDAHEGEDIIDDGAVVTDNAPTDVMVDELGDLEPADAAFDADGVADEVSFAEGAPLDEVPDARESMTTNSLAITEETLRKVLLDVEGEKSTMSSTQYQQLLADVSAIMSQTLAQSQVEQAQQADNRTFDAEQTRRNAMREYLNPDLGLFIDRTVFDNEFAYDSFIVSLPADIPTTPWLGEQAEVLAQKLNSKLLQLHQRNYEALRRAYTDHARLSIQDIVAETDDSDPGTRFGVWRDKVERDGATMNQLTGQYIADRQALVRKEFEQRKQDYISEASQRAANTWETQNAVKLQRAITAVDTDARAEAEATREEWVNVLNTARKRYAADRYDREVSSIFTEVLRPMSERMKKAEDEAFRDAQAELEKFVATHREEDLRVSTITKEKLDKDTRVEDITAEFKAKLDATKQEYDQRIDDIQNRLLTTEEHHRAELSEKDATIDAMRARVDQEIRNAQRQIDREKASFESQVEQLEAQHKTLVDNEREMAKQAQTNADQFIKSRRSENTILIFIAILVFVVVGIAGVMAGAYFF